jgi:hypothetical protein
MSDLFNNHDVKETSHNQVDGVIRMIDAFELRRPESGEGVEVDRSGEKTPTSVERVSDVRVESVPNISVEQVSDVEISRRRLDLYGVKKRVVESKGNDDSARPIDFYEDELDDVQNQPRPAKDEKVVDIATDKNNVPEEDRWDWNEGRAMEMKKEEGFKQAKGNTSVKETFLEPQTLYNSKGIGGIAQVDSLTKEDAAAAAAMLKGKPGEKIAGAEGLRIKVNGKVVAEADENGVLKDPQAKAPEALSKHFTDLSKQANRPTKGSDIVAGIADRMPDSGAKKFMQDAVDNTREQERLEVTRMAEKGSGEYKRASVADANTIIALYALKEGTEKQEVDIKADGTVETTDKYDFKDGGSITVTEANNSQTYEVSDVNGDVEMRFSVGPRGAIVLDPQISGRLQGEIDSLNQAYNRGELENAPLISTDKIRAQAAFDLAQNLGSSAGSTSKDLKVQQSSKSGRLKAESADGKKISIASNGKKGGYSVRSTTFNTEEMKKLNQSFDQTRGTEQSKNSPSKAVNGSKDEADKSTPKPRVRSTVRGGR